MFKYRGVAFIRQNIKLLFILVLPVYFHIIQTSILNKHTHFYANGLVVTHSHVADNEGDEPLNNHDHSQTEICLYCGLDIDLHISAEEIVLDLIVNNESANFIVEDVQIKYTSPRSQLIPRGPPCRIV